MRTFDDLHARVQRFIRSSLTGTPSEGFDLLACDLARAQRAAIEPTSRLWSSLGVREVEDADDIPAMPCDAFRLRRIAAHPEAEDVRTFLTSGTTAGARGRHCLRTLATYELAALSWGERMLFAGLPGARAVLLASPDPTSSLSFMLERFAAHLGGDASWHWDGEHLDVDGIARRCASAPGPVLVAGTAFAFVHLVDRGLRLPLPEGSRAMPTGGYKGRSRSVEPEDLARAIGDLFALPVTSITGEYGMTELSSQLYQDASRRYVPPPWLRVTTVAADTLKPCAGQGLARIVDLANVDSAVAIQTADMCLRHADGSIDLLGRAPGATPRGCSLAMEQLL